MSPLRDFEIELERGETMLWLVVKADVSPGFRGTSTEPSHGPEIDIVSVVVHEAVDAQGDVIEPSKGTKIMLSTDEHTTVQNEIFESVCYQDDEALNARRDASYRLDYDSDD